MIKRLVTLALLATPMSAVSAQSVTAPADSMSIGIAPPRTGISPARPLRRAGMRHGSGQSENLFGAALGAQTVLTGAVIAGAAAAAAFGLASAADDHDGRPVSP